MIFARAEGTCTHQQVVIEHSLETFAVVRLQRRPGSIEVAIPRHQRRVVISAKIMPILDGEARASLARQCRSGRQYSVGEDIFLDPSVSCKTVTTRADGVQKK